MEHARRPREAVQVTTLIASAHATPWPWWLAALVVGAILYGSLLPFRLSEPLLAGSLLTALGRIGFHSSPRADLLVNIALYVPLGFVVVLAANAQRRTTARVVGATILALLVSGTAELLQTAMPARVASWVDVRSNALGAIVGAFAGCVALRLWPGTAAAVATSWRRSPLHAASAALAVGLLLLAVVPFDFVVNGEQLRASFLSAHWDFTTVRTSAPGAPPFAALMTQVAGIGWFALLAYLWALGARQLGRDRFAAAASALKHAAILVVLCELMQLFTRSRVFDTASILLRLLGVAGGTWLALGVVDRWPRTSGRKTVWWAFPRPLVGLVLALHVLVVGVGQLGFPPAGAEPAERLRASWVPFESLWKLPWSTAMERGVSIGITFAGLAIGLLLWQRRCNRGAWVATIATSVGFAALFEWMASYGGRRPWDITQPVLATLVATVVCWGAKRLALTRVDAAASLSVTGNPDEYDTACTM